MQVDVRLASSKWQLYIELLFCLAIILLMWQSSFSIGIKLLFIAGFMTLQFVVKQTHHKRKRVAQLWQLDSLNWAWSYHDEARIYKATFVQIEYRGVVLMLTLRANNKKQHIVIWRDQVSRAQWRYFKIIANLKHSDTGILQ